MKEDLDKEIEELENELFGTPEEESTREEATIVQEEVVTPPPPSEDWEKRYKGYKASTDITIRDLRNELAAYRTKYANLQKDYATVSKKLREVEFGSEKTFSEEDIDIIGEPAANALDKSVKKILESKIKPLEEELERNRQELADRELKDANKSIKENYDVFLNKLGKIVPDFSSINVSAGFLKYMKGVDESSGSPREYLFKRAEDSLDVGRIASFFIEYKESLKVPTPEEKLLAQAVTPTGSAASKPTDVKKEELVITRNFIDKFYDDYNRGKYKTKKGQEEARRIEDLIDKAVLEGRVQ